MQRIPDSELIINSDGSVYHIKLKPEHIAKDVIVVGDPGRVKAISDRFDEVLYVIENREFVTHTGMYNGKKITVCATGIGTDNIDIVLNELDAAVNIDLETKLVKENHTSLNIVRIGTSGALHESIPVNSFLISKKAMGFDGLMHFYQDPENILEQEVANAFCAHANWNDQLAKPYVVSASKDLYNLLQHNCHPGITATASGFYAPQGRVLRLQPTMRNFPELLASFEYDGMPVTNFEMETSALYGLAQSLGHNACTVCAIIANRKTKAFSSDYQSVIHNLITHVLEALTK